MKDPTFSRDPEDWVRSSMYIPAPPDHDDDINWIHVLATVDGMKTTGGTKCIDDDGRTISCFTTSVVSVQEVQAQEMDYPVKQALTKGKWLQHIHASFGG